MQRRLCAAILTLEAVAFGLSTPVLIAVAGVATVTAAAIGGGLFLGCVLVAGLLRFRWAYVLGWLLQLAAVAVGVEVRAMAFLGILFLALWATAYFLGAKIERERAEWTATGRFPGAPGAEPGAPPSS